MSVFYLISYVSLLYFNFFFALQNWKAILVIKGTCLSLCLQKEPTDSVINPNELNLLQIK